MNGLEPIPDGLVVLTFDDGNKSDIGFVAPTLQGYGFGASFYITEGLGYKADINKEWYVSWDDVRRLHDLGFEVGNHTAEHPNMAELSKDEIRTNLEVIEQRCEQYGIPNPTTFVYPGWRHSLPVVEVLAEKGYVFARRGVRPEHPDGGRGARGRAYDPSEDHPLLIPTTGYAGPEWGFDDLVWAIDQARDGKIAVSDIPRCPGSGALLGPHRSARLRSLYGLPAGSGLHGDLDARIGPLCRPHQGADRPLRAHQQENFYPAEDGWADRLRFRSESRRRTKQGSTERPSAGAELCKHVFRGLF